MVMNNTNKGGNRTGNVFGNMKFTRSIYGTVDTGNKKMYMDIVALQETKKLIIAYCKKVTDREMKEIISD